METIGARIARAREARGMTQSQLQAACGWANNRVWKYENDRGAPGADALSKLADALDVSVDFIVRGEGADVPPPDAGNAASTSDSTTGHC